MLDNAADVIQRRIGQPRIALASERIVATHGDRLVHMHARSVIADQGFGHKRRGFAVGMCHVEHTVLKDLYLVSFGDQGVEFHANFALSGRADFMVVHFNVEPHLLHG